MTRYELRLLVLTSAMTLSFSACAQQAPRDDRVGMPPVVGMPPPAPVAGPAPSVVGRAEFIDIMRAQREAIASQSRRIDALEARVKKLEH